MHHAKISLETNRSDMPPELRAAREAARRRFERWARVRRIIRGLRFWR